MQDNYVEALITIVKNPFLWFGEVIFGKIYATEKNNILSGSYIANNFITELKGQEELFPLKNIVIKIYLTFRPWPVGDDRKKVVTIDLRKQDIQQAMDLLDIVHKSLDAAVLTFDNHATIKILNRK